MRGAETKARYFFAGSFGATEVVPCYEAQGWLCAVPPFAKNAKDGAPNICGRTDERRQQRHRRLFTI